MHIPPWRNIYTTMVVYEKYTPQGVNQEACPSHVTGLRLRKGNLEQLFALQLAAPSCEATMRKTSWHLYPTNVLVLMGTKFNFIIQCTCRNPAHCMFLIKNLAIALALSAAQSCPSLCYTLYSGMSTHSGVPPGPGTHC